MDPLMGLVGAVLVTRWSVGLLKGTSAILLDQQGPERIRQAVRVALETDGDARVADLHLWSIGPNLYSVVVSIVAREPQPPDHYKKLMPRDIGLVHQLVEVHRCSEDLARSGARTAAIAG